MTTPDDLAATALRALVLYGLAEHQSGHATTMRVFKRGAEFGISDDGRGHPLDKAIEGTPYLRFVYTHFEYPFGSSHGAPVQWQGIGMSLVTALCAELVLTVRKPGETLTATFRNGQWVDSQRRELDPGHTGITVRARLKPGLPAGDADDAALQAWLRSVAAVHPSLQLYFNERPVNASACGAGDA